MARVVLVSAEPLDPTTRAPVPVRLAGGGERPYAYDGAEDWCAGVVDVPRFSAALGYGDTGWTGGAVPTTGAIGWLPADAATLSRVAGLYWVDRRVTIRTTDDAVDGAPLATLLVAKVAKQEVADGQLQLTIADLSGDLAKPVIDAKARFAGTGGIEGDATVNGRAKRRSWGRVFNVEAQVLIAADNVYELGDPARPLHAIDRVRDKGRDAPPDLMLVIAWAGSIDATLAALRAVEPPRGGGAVAPSIACVKWWTQPSGPLTADLRGEGGDGYAESAAGIAGLIVAGQSTLTVADLANAVALRPAVAGVHAGDTSETAASLLDRVLLGVSLLWIVDPAGVVRIREWAFGTQGGGRWNAGGAASAWTPDATPEPWFAPPVLQSHGVQRKQVLRPTTSRRLGYQRNYRVQTAGEISAVVLADDVAYADGSSVAALQPAEAGADVTAANQHTLTSPAPVVVSADYLGNIATGQLPAQRSFRRLLGAADVSAQTSWSVSTPDGVTATIDDIAGDEQRGTVTISDAAAAQAALTIKSTYGGVDLYGQLAFTRQDASSAPASGGGAGTSGGGAGASGGGTSAPGNAASASPDALPQDATWTPITPAMTVNVGSSGNVTLAFQLSYGAVRGYDGDDDTVMLARFAQQAADGSWSAVGDPATGSGADNFFRTEPPRGATSSIGNVSTALTATGLAAGAAASFRVEASIRSGEGVATITGDASATPL